MSVGLGVESAGWNATERVLRDTVPYFGTPQAPPTPDHQRLTHLLSSEPFELVRYHQQRNVLEPRIAEVVQRFGDRATRIFDGDVDRRAAAHHPSADEVGVVVLR